MKILLANLGRSIRFFVFACSFLMAEKGNCQDPLTNWNEVYPCPVAINSMAYGNGTFIGVGNGLRAISHDGSNWTLYANAPFLNQATIVYGNGYFLTFGTNTQSTATVIYQSTSGLDYVPLFTNSQSLFAAAFGNNTWVFIGTNTLLTATLTQSNWNWTISAPAFNPTCLTYVNGQFILAAYQDGDGTDLIFKSTDGQLWQYLSTLPMDSYNYNGLAYGNDVYAVTTFIYTGITYEFDTWYYNYNAIINISTNLINWTPTCTNFDNFNFEPVSCVSMPIMFGGQEFYTCLSDNESAFTSTNGATWDAAPDYDFVSFAYGQGTFVAGSGFFSGGIYQSGIITNSPSLTPFNLNLSTFAGVTINGTAGLTYQIQYATSLNTNWTALTNVVLPYSPYLWIDTSTIVIGQRFYRAVQIQ